jgi:effector-binding domain-containing protein
MKKLIIGVILTISVLALSLYLFIPGRLKINEIVTMNATMDGVARTLSAGSNWNKWWPGDTVFHFNKKKFQITAYELNGFDIRIISNRDSLQSRMNLIFLDNDSMLVDWQAQLKSSSAPFKRFSQFMKVKEIGKDINAILTSLKNFAEDPQNIYGIKVVKAIVTDSVLISTRRSFDHKPDVQEIDDMIQSLKNYIKQNGAVEKNLPMLNVMKTDNSYVAMTAIPVDRELPATNEFASKFMLKGGNILEAEIKGGPFTIERSFNELENYRADHKYTSPAIPFQSLVTDRAREKDTAKWITKLYYPVF